MPALDLSYPSPSAISRTNLAWQYGARMAWLGMRGLWLFLVPFMVVGEVQADCGPADDPVITCAGNTMGAVPIDPGIDTTVNVDPGATVSNSPEVIDFSPGSATNAVNN